MNRIRELRKNRGMTQEELANVLNVQRAMISKYENEQAELSRTLLEKLSNTFGVSIDYIVNNPNANLMPQENSAPHAEKGSELVAMSKNLDDNNYKTVVNFIKLLAENAERSKKSQLSDDELKLVDDYRALDDTDKQTVKNIAGKLRLVVGNSRQGHLPLGSNNHVEVGTIAAPTNITATQNVGVPK